MSAGGIQIAAASGARAKRSDVPPFFFPPLSQSYSGHETGSDDICSQREFTFFRFIFIVLGKTNMIIQTTVGADETTCNNNNNNNSNDDVTKRKPSVYSTGGDVFSGVPIFFLRPQYRLADVVRSEKHIRFYCFQTHDSPQSTYTALIE